MSKVKLDIVLTPDLEKALKSLDKPLQSVEGNLKDISKSSTKAGKSLEKTTKQSSQGFKNLSKTIGSTTKLLGGLAAAAVGILGTLGLKESIELAGVQQDALNKLTVALNKTGEAARLPEFEAFASSLQAVTKFGDEAILSQAAVAQALGATADQSKKVVTAAADLAAATGVSLESAVQQITKTLGGMAGRLGQTIPALRELSAEQLKAGEGIDVIAKQFKGFAEGEAQTFTGALQQTKNAFGDFLETVGSFVTQNSVVTAGLQKLTAFFGNLAANGPGLLSKAFINLIPAVKGLLNVIKVVIPPILNLFELLLTLMLQVSKGISFVRNAFLSLNIVQKVINNISLAFLAVIDTILGGVKTLASSLGELVGVDTSKLTKGIENIQGAIEGIAEKDFAGTLVDGLEKSDQIRDSIFESIIDAAKKGQENLDDLNVDNLVDQFKDFAKDVADVKIGASTPAQESEDKPNEGSGDVDGALAGLARVGQILRDIGDTSVSVAENTLEGIGKAVVEFGKQFANILIGSSDKVQSIDDQIANQRLKANSRDINERRAAQIELNRLEKEKAEVSKDAATDTVKAFVSQIPEIGGALAGIIDLLKNPEAIKGLIDGIVQALPEVIDALIEAVPIVVEALIENLPKIIDTLIEKVPQLIVALIQAAPAFITALIKKIPDIIKGFVKALPEITAAIIDALPEIIEAIIIALPDIIVALAGAMVDVALALISALIKLIPRVIQALVRGIRVALGPALAKITEPFTKLGQIFKNLAGSFQRLIDKIKKFFGGGGDGGTAGKFARGDFAGVAKDIGGRLGFAQGGFVKGSGNRDTVPALLSPGELVVDRQTGPQLREFLNNPPQQDGNGADLLPVLTSILTLLQQPVNVQSTVEVRDQVFADIILELQRDNLIRGS